MLAHALKRSRQQPDAETKAAGQEPFRRLAQGLHGCARGAPGGLLLAGSVEQEAPLAEAQDPTVTGPGILSLGVLPHLRS